jgi:DNA-binding CsgD family transcriptional regulator
MAIKIATARAYLKQIFAKTGINRQSSLIRLLLTSRVPLMLGAHHG